MQRYSKAMIFVGLTFLLSWGLFFTFLGLGNRFVTFGSSQAAVRTFIMMLIYMVTPAIAALIVQKGIYRQPVIGPLGLSFRLNRWWLVAWLLPPLFALAAQAASILLIPHVEYSPEMANLLRRISPTEATPDFINFRNWILSLSPIVRVLLALPFMLVAGATINALFGLGEELGWRGLLQRELAPLGFWRYSLVIGIIWGLWHAPVIWQGYNYPEHPRLGVLWMTIFTVLFTPLMCYVRLRAKSVIAAAIMHGTLNATAVLGFMFLYGGSDLTVGIMGLAGFIVLAGLNIALFLLDPSLINRKGGMLE